MKKIGRRVLLLVGILGLMSPVSAGGLIAYACHYNLHSAVHERRCIGNRHGRWKINPSVLKTTRYDKHGVASLVIKDARFFYYNREGRVIEAVAYDNGADYFVDGKARFLGSGKMGFIDQQMKIVIPATFDFVTPFRKGRAAACKGCKVNPNAEEDHAYVTGGVWGIIDAEGNWLVPLTLTKQEAMQQR